MLKIKFKNKVILLLLISRQRIVTTQQALNILSNLS